MSKSPIKKLSAATVAGTVAFATLAAPSASAVEMTYKDGVCTYVFNQEEMSIPGVQTGYGTDTPAGTAQSLPRLIQIRDERQQLLDDVLRDYGDKPIPKETKEYLEENYYKFIRVLTEIINAGDACMHQRNYKTPVGTELSEEAKIGLIVAGSVLGAVALVAILAPAIIPLLPPQIQTLLPR